MRRLSAGLVVCALFFIVPVAGQFGREIPLPERAKGAARIVVASVVDTSSRFERNLHGDEQIITRAQLRIEEALKGPTAPVTVVIEGGTVNGVTMRNSNAPTLVKGERGVFFLTPGPNGDFRLHLRARGLLKLDKDAVRGTKMTLDEVKRQVKS